MAIDKDMLEAMRAMLRDELKPIKEEQKAVIARLEAMEGKQDKLREDVAHLNHELVPKVKVIYDGLTGQRDKLPRLDVVEGRVEKLEDDMFAVKERLKAE